MNTSSDKAIRCVGAVLHDETGRLLLVQRATDPGRSRWSIPGGRVLPGETDEAAVRRELREETGLDVAVGGLLGTVHRPAPGGAVYDIHDYSARVTGGTLIAGDDAAAARWVTAEEYATLDLVPGLTDALSSWDALPRSTPESARNDGDARMCP